MLSKTLVVATMCCWILSAGAGHSADAPDHGTDKTEAARPADGAADMRYDVAVRVTEKGNRTLVADVRGHRIVIDQPREFGADDKGPTPPELLAVSFASCIASTIQLLALRNGLEITDISVTVEGSIDFSKAMGISDEARAGFSGLTATVDFTSSLDAAARRKLIGEVARIGAALDNIENATPARYIVN